MYNKFFKRFLDILISFTGLILISPLLFLVALILAWHNKGTPFFYQVRPGKDQRAFKIIKFKTMTDERDEEGDLLPDIQRMTKLGKIIRKTSIDELPQLLNVLKGEMSLVGPRPLLFKYMPLYSNEQLRRHEIRPGITGWAQVNGRNAISWTNKFKLDLEYVEKIGFMMDLRILYLTVLKVLKKEGVNQSQERPMEPFDGKN